MCATVYQFELRSKLKSAFIWSLAIAAITLIYFSLFPSLAKEAALMNEAMEQMPPELLAAFGMTGVDLSTVMGFYSFVFLFAQVLLAIQASNYGFGLVSVEEADMTADFLLTKPLTRSQILTSKLLAAFTALSITNALTWLSSFLFITLFRDGREYDVHTLLLLLASIAIFQLFFLSVGLVISLLVRRVRNVTPYALGLAFGMYLLGAFSDMAGDVKLEWITPFKHFDANAIIRTGAYELPLVMISVAVILIALAGSYWRYLHRDIPAVA
jgi:ABC-2 type transport system permease protein